MKPKISKPKIFRVLNYNLLCFASTKEFKKLLLFIGLMVSKWITKKKKNESIKIELLNSLPENDDVEEQGFNAKANNVNNSQEAIQVINRYKDIIKAQIKKKTIGYIDKQRELL